MYAISICQSVMWLKLAAVRAVYAMCHVHRVIQCRLRQMSLAFCYVFPENVDTPVRYIPLFKSGRHWMGLDIHRGIVCWNQIVRLLCMLTTCITSCDLCANVSNMTCKGKGRWHLIWHLFMGQPHHRGAQVWHTFLKDHTVLPATHAFIHNENGMTHTHLCLPSWSWPSFTYVVIICSDHHASLGNWKCSRPGVLNSWPLGPKTNTLTNYAVDACLNVKSYSRVVCLVCLTGRHFWLESVNHQQVPVFYLNARC